ncbi:mechanosensitive ion channel family protein [Ureibacillus sinduriensis]|uniref:Mechanosensitive ion channel protein MscS n=1 Tax=Ureibacillus sinduriensis BLB-1 = JCM 15800 TaxID=1384057 RepID=A0A0A3HYI9_9BACL|nr:mechanosensitive ion channel family protein [Ureibacillus sinduriensis]KGR75443.1 mechanosensitive ion channel protein MscS [Ureibacillus sinduriensis BLB-1 = JCM 15800]
MATDVIGDQVEEQVKEATEFSEKIWDYFTSEELWSFVLSACTKILAILLVSYLVIFIGKRIITRILTLKVKTPLNQNERRQQTIIKLLHSTLSYLVYFSAMIAILSAVEINIGGLLAGAGIAGLAIGFGAQSLVKDIITGFFIILEDQFGIGDYIRLNNAEGTVTEIGLRTTKILGTTGEQYIIPNGQILDVVNFSVNNSKAIIDMQVAIDADIEKVEKLVSEYLKTLPPNYEELIDVPAFLGVQNVVGTEVTIRIIAETKPLQHYGIARVIRRDVKEILERNGIPMAYPKMMLYDRGSKESGGDES